MVHKESCEDCDEDLVSCPECFGKLCCESCDCLKKTWLLKYNLSAKKWKEILVQVPNKKLGLEGYLRLEFIGNKQDIASKQEKDFAKWMKLTEKLFL